MMLTFRRMRASDLKDLMGWGLHEDVRYHHYDFRHFNMDDFENWFHYKQMPPLRTIYALLDEGKVVGYVTLKHIQWLQREAEFGLVIDPNHLNCGYGKEGLTLFLTHCFTKLPLVAMNLKVSVFNKRAFAVYESLGFKVYREGPSPFEDQSRNFDLLLLREDFHMKGRVLMTETKYMKLTKRDFLKLKT